MTAINFPDSPSDGDTHVVGGVTYTYNNAETKWKTTINSNAFLPLTGGTVSGNILMGGEIQHDGDTDTNISFDTDTILFDTAGSERFRVGSAGQLGIGGATYGTSGQVLTSQGSSAAPQWATPTDNGRILQVVSTVKSDTFSTTSGAGSPVTITGLSASITPASTDNKVLVMVHLGMVGISGDSTYGFTLFRGTTALCQGDAAGNRPRMSVGAGHSFATNWRAMQNSISFLDSPSTTSSTTYSVRMGHNGNSSYTMYLNRSSRDSNGTNEDVRAASTITVMEVAG